MLENTRRRLWPFGLDMRDGQVPRSRNGIAGWRAFVDSLGRQFVLDDKKERNQSRLLVAVRQAMETSGTYLSTLGSSVSTIGFLRDLFERRDKAAREHTTALRAYHSL